MVKIGTILSRKSLKDPSWLAMCNVYFRNKLPTEWLGRYVIQHKGDILPKRTCGDFFLCRLCINTAISNGHVVSFREYSDNR